MDARGRGARGARGRGARGARGGRGRGRGGGAAQVMGPEQHRAGVLWEAESCPDCGAFKFLSEKLNCCGGGRVRAALGLPRPLPAPIVDAVAGRSDDSPDFFNNVLRINQYFSPAVVEPFWRRWPDHSDARADGDVARALMMRGDVRRRLKTPEEVAASVWWFEDRGNGNNDDDDEDEDESLAGLMARLRSYGRWLFANNPFRRFLMTARHSVDAAVRRVREGGMAGGAGGSADDDAPVPFASRASSNALAALFDGGWEAAGGRAVRGELVEALCYGAMFASGAEGWSREGLAGRRGVSDREHYVFHAMQRPSLPSAYLMFGRLSQQYVLDRYARVEQERLRYLRENVDARLLPVSHEGGRRFSYAAYRDSRAIEREVGRGPRLFITMTCNPRWREVTGSLHHDFESAFDRSDLLARVFNVKRADLIDRLNDGSLRFGHGQPLVGHVSRVEFSPETGLPHVHVMVWTPGERQLSLRALEENIKAVIPAEEGPDRDLVLRYAIHGPCGALNPSAPCMQDGACRFGMPARMCSESVVRNGRFVPKRPNDGVVGTVMVRGQPVQVTNEWVSPYCPELLRRYQCHSNVQYDKSGFPLSYLEKEAFDETRRSRSSSTAAGAHLAHQQNTTTHTHTTRNAGEPGTSRQTDDRVAAGGVDNADDDEYRRHLEARIVGPTEANYRLFGFATRTSSHQVVRLGVHLPRARGLEATACETGADDGRGRTQLEAFFLLVAQDVEVGARLKYVDVPKSYRFADGRWTRRARERTARPIVGRTYPLGGEGGAELRALERLLNEVRGPRGFDHLHVVAGVWYATFAEAAAARQV